MLLKYLQKFFSKAGIPWVNLVWETYYSNGKLPGLHKKGSFWWKDLVKLLDKFKGLLQSPLGMVQLCSFGRIFGKASS
jgi:hypothetical protein